MIDFDKLRAIASEIAVIAVGHMVSQFDASGNPSVIREYSSVKEPPYPFVTYDVRHVNAHSQKSINSWVDGQGRSWQEFVENIDLKYCAKGDRSQEIIHELYNNLRLISIRQRIAYRYPGLSIEQLMSIKPAPTVNGTQYIEEHSFIVRLTLCHKVHDKFTTQIEAVNIQGSLSNQELDSDFELIVSPTPQTP
jgi:hypothetical protein